MWPRAAPSGGDGRTQQRLHEAAVAQGQRRRKGGEGSARAKREVGGEGHCGAWRGGNRRGTNF
jgi:hypothetical protein